MWWPSTELILSLSSGDTAWEREVSSYRPVGPSLPAQVTVIHGDRRRQAGLRQSL